MSGPIALHGGGEFQSGDEPFLERLLELARSSRGDLSKGPLRIAIVPTAAARGRPALVGAHGTAAFERVASAVTPEGSASIRVEVVDVLDAASAADPDLVSRLVAADVIHLPGGDPDLIPTILSGTAVWEAIVEANRRGAVLAGASAGAMALATWTWTQGGGMPGLGLVPGLIVVPHANAGSWANTSQRVRTGIPHGLGLLGVAERTAVISRPLEGPIWDVVGEGEARWQAEGADPDATSVVKAGGTLRLPR